MKQKSKKLTAQEVIEIRNRSNWYSPEALAKQFGVTPTVIRKITASRNDK
jgi:hypothetical protein